MKKILIIEDDKFLCETAADFLNQTGYKPITAFSGADGIQKAFTEVPDLIICDISMPKIDGYEVFNTLQKSPYTSVIPFIFLTARTEKSDLRTGMLLGADDYITKPFQFEELLLSIQTRLKKQDKIKEINEEKIKSIIDNSPIGIALIENDRILYVNEALEEITGFSEIELKKLNFFDIISSHYKSMINEKLKFVRRGIKNVQFDLQLQNKNNMPVEVVIYLTSAKNNTTIAKIQPKSEKEFQTGKSDLSLEKAITILQQNKEMITWDLIVTLKEIFQQKNIKNQSNKRTTKNISKRELQVLNQVCQGLSNEEIGKKLKISYRTVERHRTNLIRKTNSKNIIEVIIYALRQGLISI